MMPLDTMVRNKLDCPKTEELNVEDTINRLKTPKKRITKWLLRKIIPICRNAVGSRELTKSHTITTVHKLRLAYRNLAKLMVKENRLSDEKLLYFLTHYEIGMLLKQQDPTLVQKATRKRKLHQQLEKVRYNELNFGIPIPIKNMAKNLTKGNDVKVCGTAVSNDSVEGRACVILDSKEANDIIKSGDILITTCTDIGWTPYFPLLGGVVTELGGLISHGAVVAREYGLPCLVGASGATQLFKTGDTVLLKGDTCTLHLVKKFQDSNA